ncbi:MAG: CYTH domain-containing protein [Pseudomonadota bacterium]
MCAHLGVPAAERPQHNLFVDTRDGALRAASLALRLRREPGRGLITVKGPARRHGEVADRLEIECVVDAEQAQTLWDEPDRMRALDAAPIHHLGTLLESGPLLEVARFTNLRRSYPWSAADQSLVLEVDRTLFTDGSEDFEVEVELQDAALATPVTAALHALLDVIGVEHQAQPLSKLTRALRHR